MAEQKVAFITGANKGIGFEICRQLAARHFRVLLGARNPDLGHQACEELSASGADARFVQLDVTRPDSIHAASEAVASLTNHLDVLVNNAGICEDAKLSVLQVSPEIVQRTFETNTLGPLLLTQRLGPLLLKSKAGRIINVSSGLGSLTDMGSGYPSYRISKAALNALTRILAAELAPKKVAVNSVSPGWVRTDMGGSDAKLSVEEGADSIVWLAADAPQSLTGRFIADRKAVHW